MHVWRKVYHTEAIISESNEEVERTTLTLAFNGNEPDIEAMLKLYDDAEDPEPWDESDSLSGKSTSEPLDRKDLSGKKGRELPDKAVLSGKIAKKISLSGKTEGKMPMTEAFADKLADICIYISQHPHSAKENISAFIQRSDESAKKYLQALVSIGLITPEGGNRNRTYSVR